MTVRKRKSQSEALALKFRELLPEYGGSPTTVWSKLLALYQAAEAIGHLAKTDWGPECARLCSGAGDTTVNKETASSSARLGIKSNRADHGKHQQQSRGGGVTVDDKEGATGVNSKLSS